MVAIYTIPNWFSGYDIVMELIFALITGLVAFYAFKVYSLSKQRESKLLGAGFSLISLSYLLWAALNFSIMDRLDDGVTILDLGKLTILNYYSLYLHIFLFLFGLITIAYMTFKLESVRLYSLLLLLMLLEILGAFNIINSFYITSAIIILTIVTYYLRSYIENHNPKTLLVLVAFVLLLSSSLNFIVFKQPNVQYVVSHCFNLLAYSLILISLVMVVRGNRRSRFLHSLKLKAR